MPRPMNFKLDTRMEDYDPTSASGAMTSNFLRSKIKVARSRDQSEPSWPNAVAMSAGRGHTMSAEPGDHTVKTPSETHLLKVVHQQY